ncbi:MAG TPA: ABC transporter ATP-binding protein [Acidimicrobiales bacterium]|nr:ABC transporter ATP-binding protein [Acidimicrobiales bacterium]
MPERDVVSTPLLQVENLQVSFATRGGVVRAVDGLSFAVGRKEVLGVVGESGSGKSVAMYSMLGLLREANVSVSGSVKFEDREILGLADREMRSIRGGDIGMIFQDPMTALTPVYRVGWQIAEQIRAHSDATKAQARQRAIELLGEVGIPEPARRVDQFPHEFSGGMRQRVVIAMALSCNPKLLIADEPTTALDVTTQAQILELMGRLQETYDSSIVLITHDMGVISEMADRVVVMYAGRPAEIGDRRDVIRTPQHPYTWGLLGAVPRVETKRSRLATIPGTPVSPLNVPTGCAFAPRCAHRFSQCDERPVLRGDGHQDACWLSDEQKVTLRQRDVTSASSHD